MKGRYARLVIIFVILFQMFVPGVSQVYAKTSGSDKQPAICAWPSDTLQLYFQFQNEAISALYSSDIQAGKLSLSNNGGRLFTRGNLKLPTSALDHVVDSMWWRTSSIISTTSTSVVLLSLASAWVIESNVEGLAIFFKDRPIVRDYKELLDIDTQLFETAFSFSHKVDLTRPAEWNVVDNFKAVVKKYQDAWLLRKWFDINWNISMANILLELASMNASMKYFITVWGEVWASELRSYAWCLWKQGLVWKCNASNLLLWFNLDAVNKLKQDYKGNWFFGKCNSYVSNFTSSISKSAGNNLDSIKAAWNDIQASFCRLINALVWEWTCSKLTQDPCEMTDYERALIEAYLWWEWVCKGWKWDSVAAMLAKIEEYEKNKKTAAWESEKSDNLTKSSSNPQPPSLFDLISDLSEAESTEDKKVIRYRIYSGESAYNPEFSYDMNYELLKIFSDVTDDFEHSERAAMASDLSYQLVKIKWLVDQVGAAMNWATELRKDLQDIVNYQCSM